MDIHSAIDEVTGAIALLPFSKREDLIQVLLEGEPVAALIVSTAKDIVYVDSKDAEQLLRWLVFWNRLIRPTTIDQKEATVKGVLPRSKSEDTISSFEIPAPGCINQPVHRLLQAHHRALIPNAEYREGITRQPNP